MDKFEELASTISVDERRNMLEKIKKDINLSSEPLIDEDLDEDVDLDDHYLKLSILQKIIFFIKSLFTGKNKYELIEDHLIYSLAQDIQRKSPGIIDFSSDTFTSEFYKNILPLKEISDFFRPILAELLGKYKMEFIAHLASIELVEITERLLKDTDPLIINTREPDKADTDIRILLETNLEEIFSSINPEDRKILYQDMKLMQLLLTFSSLGFGKILEKFKKIGDDSQQNCSLISIEKFLSRLTDVLNSMKTAPSLELLEGIFLFFEQDKIGKGDIPLDDDNPIEKSVKQKVKIAADCLSRLRDFNKRIPLKEILKYSKKNIHYRPLEIGGAEDWFVLYRQYWRRMMENKYKDFVRNRKKQEIKKEINVFIGVAEMPLFKDYSGSEMALGVIGRFNLALSFLKIYYERIFSQRVEKFLKIIMLEGAFYKEENRVVFTDGYDGLLKIGTFIEKLLYDISREGSSGSEIEKIRHEAIALALKTKKIQTVFQRIDKTAEDFIKDTMDNLKRVTQVIDGILYGEAGGQFDTLSNIDAVGGRSNKSFLANLDYIMANLRNASELLGRVFDLEKNS
jgi:hypothetical protein